MGVYLGMEWYNCSRERTQYAVTRTGSASHQRLLVFTQEPSLFWMEMS